MKCPAEVHVNEEPNGLVKLCIKYEQAASEWQAVDYQGHRGHSVELHDT